MNAIISGICGKMGKYIYEAAKKYGVNVVCGIDKVISGDFDCPVYKNFDEINDYADVIIDFSSPQNSDALIEYSVKNKIPLVIGTTGYNKKQEDKIYKASRQIPVFKSSNTSRGVFLMLKLCEFLSKELPDYDAEIIDFHHSRKKDAPSGASYSILDTIASASNGNEKAVFGRYGKTQRNKGEIGVHSVRGGGVVGEHEVFFFGENECVSIKHVAYSKALFAEGAIRAAEFIVGKPPELYGMDDLR